MTFTGHDLNAAKQNVIDTTVKHNDAKTQLEMVRVAIIRDAGWRVNVYAAVILFLSTKEDAARAQADLDYLKYYFDVTLDQ